MAAALSAVVLLGVSPALAYFVESPGSARSAVTVGYSPVSVIRKLYPPCFPPSLISEMTCPLPPGPPRYPRFSEGFRDRVGVVSDAAKPLTVYAPFSSERPHAIM